MITLIILIVLIAIGCVLSKRESYGFGHDYQASGVLMIITFGLLLIFHSIAWRISFYEYEVFVEKRNAFEQTLKHSREVGNEYETAAIVTQVAEWNIDLASRKYDNKTIFINQYVDDRIELLEPIN